MYLRQIEFYILTLGFKSTHFNNFPTTVYQFNT